MMKRSQDLDILHPAPWRSVKRMACATATLAWWLALGLTLGALSACAELPYYLQSVSGHLQVMRAARPIDSLLQSAQLSTQLRTRLHSAQQLRRFAVAQLSLPDNASYHQFADIKRPYVVWNVVATPAYALELKTWCFPVMGCVAYRGYYDQAQAQAFAAGLQEQDLDVSVYGVPAYSTLGWLNWVGGDPLLNTWANYPDGELARLMFHELAHQVLYIGSDTVFDESFATTVERLGTRQWLRMQASPEDRRVFAQSEQRRVAFRAMTRAASDKLRKVYEQPALSDDQAVRRAAQKTQVMAQFRLDYAALKASWGGYSGYDGWVEKANNAAFAAQAAYDDHVPGFEALFQEVNASWPDFYAAVKRLAQLPKPQRSQRLRDLAASRPAFEAVQDHAQWPNASAY